MARTIHIIGAGLAGLSAAVRLIGRNTRIVVHEATGQVGGRCRSYYDSATDLTIDNGNHLLLSANHAALGYAKTIGSADHLVGPPTPDFNFIDLRSHTRWTLRISPGRIPSWIFDASRRVPDTSPRDYFRLAPLLLARSDKPLRDVIPCEGPLYERLVQPLMLAALNVDPKEGSSRLAAQIVRETLAAGGQACRPLIAATGLSDALIEPAVEYLEARGAEIILRHELRAIEADDKRVYALDFGDERIAIAEEDAVVIAVPAYAAAALIPGLGVPTDFRPILNAHFRIAPPRGMPSLLGVVNATTEWIFAFPNRLSVTISGAERLMPRPREELAQEIWHEVSDAAGISGTPLPPWQIVRERRATFASTPKENAKRPGTKLRWSNAALAGDWTQTGLPATIEGAIRSGDRAAEILMSVK